MSRGAPLTVQPDGGEKLPFDIDTMLARIEEAVAPWPAAALFTLAEEGYRSPFEQLLACIISIRTLDEVTLLAFRRLAQRARTADTLLALTADEIDALISPSTFHTAKAWQMLAIARRVRDEWGGNLPCNFEAITSLHGVGPKCANLVLGIACNQARVSVDVHVHRVTNRWGYVVTRTPEETMAALEGELPVRHHVTINRLLVPFGKHICTGKRPHCSTCPVLRDCRQVGVVNPR
jgi:endonuclease-3